MEREVRSILADVKTEESCGSICDGSRLNLRRIELAFTGRPSAAEVSIVAITVICRGIKLLGDRTTCEQQCSAQMHVRAYDIEAQEIDSFVVEP
jgi:hypothetical protein